MMGKSRHQRRNGLRHAGGVDNQDDGQAKDPRQISAGACAVRRGTVEKAHGPLDQKQIVGRRAGPGGGGGHRPSVKVQAGLARGRGMIGGVNVVGSGFRAAHADASAGEGAQQSKRDGGLAAAGRGGREDQARHRASDASGGSIFGKMMRGMGLGRFCGQAAAERVEVARRFALRHALPVQDLAHQHRAADADDGGRLEIARSDVIDDGAKGGL